jgi:hypothetical protein
VVQKQQRDVREPFPWKWLLPHFKTRHIAVSEIEASSRDFRALREGLKGRPIRASRNSARINSRLAKPHNLPHLETVNML